MCGRFTQLRSRDELARLFGCHAAGADEAADDDDAPYLFPRYNAAPT